MIDKTFYLENLSAFDILIQDEDRKQAEEVIFRVYSILQRDKIWLHEVATREEIFEEDVELLEEVEQELKELDEQYDFRFDEFNKLVQQEMKKLQSNSNVSLTEVDDFQNEEDDIFYGQDDEELEDITEDFETEDEEDFLVDGDFYDEDDDESDDVLSHLSDEEIDLVPEFILESAKKRFNYPAFLESFPVDDEFFVEEEFLFPVIVGKAFGESSMEISEKIHSSMMMHGYVMEKTDLLQMIDQKGKEMGPEILAFKVASDSLQQGAHPRDVVAQIAPLLRS